VYVCKKKTIRIYQALVKSDKMPAVTHLRSTQPTADVEIMENVIQAADSGTDTLEMVVASRQHPLSCTTMDGTGATGHRRRRNDLGDGLNCGRLITSTGCGSCFDNG